MKKIERLKEIIKIAYKLKWISPPNNTSYPLMQLSEVEKCMLAMIDDSELLRMKQWFKAVEEKDYVSVSEDEYYQGKKPIIKDISKL